MAFRNTKIQGDDSWVCSGCKNVVRNFIVEDVDTTQDYLQVLIVEPDEAMTKLREAVGMEVEPSSVAENCKHDRYFRAWCQQWRRHRHRTDFVSKIIDIRLKDLNECLDEWFKISQEYNEAGDNTARKRYLSDKVLKFRLIYKDMLNKDGPGADESFQKEMEVMRKHRDQLLAGVPAIKQGILDLKRPCRTQILKVIKAQADKFEASGVQPRRGEWTVVKFYKDLKAACIESDKAAGLNEPLGFSDEENLEDAAEHPLPLTSKTRSQTGAVSEGSDTLLTDMACLLKLFSTMKSLPMTGERPSMSQADLAAQEAQAEYALVATQKVSDEMTLSAQIEVIDMRIKTLECDKKRIINSLMIIRQKLGEVLPTETESDTENAESEAGMYSDSTHVDSSETSE